MKLRKSIRVLHRDLGYFWAFLIIVYSLSGIAVNHIDDWNPNYIIEHVNVEFTGYGESSDDKAALEQYIITQLGIKDSLRSSFFESETELHLFFENKTVEAEFRLGKAEIETVTGRPVFKMVNFLHLNEAKKVWTYVADIFGVCLIILSITGMFILKGKNGLSGRGKWFFAGGVLLPIIFIILYY